jgi:hypothetical protein
MDGDIMDNVDRCLVCAKNIPSGPDFCSLECEEKWNLQYGSHCALVHPFGWKSDGKMAGGGNKQ